MSEMHQWRIVKVHDDKLEVVLANFESSRGVAYYLHETVTLYVEDGAGDEGEVVLKKLAPEPGVPIYELRPMGEFDLNWVEDTKNVLDNAQDMNGLLEAFSRVVNEVEERIKEESR